MQKVIFASVAFVLGVLVCAAQAPDIKNMDVVERSVPDGPVAIVDGVAIQGKEFIQEYRRHLGNVMNLVKNPNVNDEFRVHAGLTILGDMVRAEILLKEAEKRKVTVPDADVQAEYTNKLQHFADMLKQQGGGEASEAQILEKAGQTREEAMASIRRQLIVEKVSDLIAKDEGVKITNEEARSYYDKNPQLFQMPGRIHLSQILAVPKPSAAKADESAWKKAEEKMERARARVLAGEQFAAVARDMSEAPDAAKGGDMGMVMASGLPPFFVELASKMKPGDISGVFRSEYGVHVIRLAESEPSQVVAFDEAAEKIKLVLRRAKMEEAVLKFCEPIVNDPDRTKVFIQLERTLATLSEEKKPS